MTFLRGFGILLVLAGIAGMVIAYDLYDRGNKNDAKGYGGAGAAFVFIGVIVIANGGRKKKLG
jgi:hypothetical protein